MAPSKSLVFAMNVTPSRRRSSGSVPYILTRSKLSPGSEAVTVGIRLERSSMLLVAPEFPTNDCSWASWARWRPSDQKSSLMRHSVLDQAHDSQQHRAPQAAAGDVADDGSEIDSAPLGAGKQTEHLQNSTAQSAA